MNFIKEEHRVYLQDEQKQLLAEVTFPEVSLGNVDIDHTYVDDSLRGQGIAGQLMLAAYEVIKASGKKTFLSCPYAKKWFAQHLDYQDIVN